jgi:hypothetical protein
MDSIRGGGLSAPSRQHEGSQTNRGLRVHPLAVGLLLASLALAAACQWLPALRAWSWLAGWMVVWGAAALAVTLVGLRWSRRFSDPVELLELHAIRQALARRLGQQRSNQRDRPSTWTDILSEAIERIDDDIEPALRELLIRHSSVSRHLRLYERGSLPLPDNEIVERLRAIERRHRAAIDGQFGRRRTPKRRSWLSSRRATKGTSWSAHEAGPTSCCFSMTRWSARYQATAR